MTSNEDKMEIDHEGTELDVVLPGDPINIARKDDLKLGPGLTLTQDSVICIKAGLLKHFNKKNKWYVESNQKRYIPAEGDPVIGIVTYKGGEYYRLDIGSAHQAILPILAFPNVNKKSRPILNIGSLVYARITLANKDMEPEVACCNPKTNKDEGFGELKNGFVIKCSLRYCRRIISQETEICSLLKKLGEKHEINLAIGMNGRIWIRLKSDDTRDTIYCYDVIKRAENLDNDDISELINSLND
ncbi:hypothetical protein RclHR1_01930024 [Rhizophagus clarus]|uniref:Ribosomal RNA-processing protein 40 n=1 Tax=Rhizophagus clarus TaxID=94130 RepID=A0A2Z6QTN1_9GLOM|nr:hypothetical protein RclHR1_01930024 [Rhizophagus clarus]GES87085.1 exosome complex exonuclease RRP40 [Rhizophagus clarus]